MTPTSFSKTSNDLIIRHKRIIGGMNASIKERWAFAPSLKSIIEGEEEFGQCSATVISKRHLLTAAHCVIHIVKVNQSSDIKHM
uniref:Peptidase S1 domain-containing protein n=1 Tax=Panagrolaimus davidi TaxID=227884 RepID=A0A914PHJ8_9BILA